MSSHVSSDFPSSPLSIFVPGEQFSLDATSSLFAFHRPLLHVARLHCFSTHPISVTDSGFILLDSATTYHEISALGRAGLSREVQGSSSGVQDSMSGYEGPWQVLTYLQGGRISTDSLQKVSRILNRPPTMPTTANHCHYYPSSPLSLAACCKARHSASRSTAGRDQNRPRHWRA
jgi:hypothetical protein